MHISGITFDRSTPLSTERPIVRIFHDKLTLFANADQSFHWADKRVQVLKQKSLGQALVSDFIDEVDGYLTHNGEEARDYLEHQSQGFWTNEHVTRLKNIKNVKGIGMAKKSRNIITCHD